MQGRPRTSTCQCRGTGERTISNVIQLLAQKARRLLHEPPAKGLQAVSLIHHRRHGAELPRQTPPIVLGLPLHVIGGVKMKLQMVCV